MKFLFRLCQSSMDIWVNYRSSDGGFLCTKSDLALDLLDYGTIVSKHQFSDSSSPTFLIQCCYPDDHYSVLPSPPKERTIDGR
jgi:hypothetical protein